jgi:hypothetical protein
MERGTVEVKKAAGGIQRANCFCGAEYAGSDAAKWADDHLMAVHPVMYSEQDFRTAITFALEAFALTGKAEADADDYDKLSKDFAEFLGRVQGN